MRKTLLSIATLCCGIVGMMLVAAPANAQATRTWVSGVGDDANPCSRTAPCKTFAGAISKTAPSGEINVLDPGGFGAVTITKAITISSEGFEAGVLVSGTNGIIVNVPNATDAVLLKGLDIEGLGTGLTGVLIIGNGKTTIVKCHIRHFTGAGVFLNGVAGARALLVDNIITQNAGGGFNIAGAGGVANTGLAMRNMFDNNTNFSIQVATGSNLFVGENKLLGSAASVAGAGSVTTFGDNAMQGTAPAMTPNNLK